MTEDIKLLAFDFATASETVLQVLMEDASDPEIFRDILTANTGRIEVLKLLLDSADVPDDIREEARKYLSLPVELGKMPRKDAQATTEQRKQSILKQIQALTVGEKVALAMRGGSVVRSILAKDSNKEVVLCVLKNPKVNATEAEMIAHSRNVPEDALRLIAKNREWMKNYAVVTALVNNPKTPVGLASALVTNLRTKDMAILENNKNVSEAVRATARRLIATRKPK
ncbi:MAG TPA: hypothetical protein DCP92_14070 [Nitrospiraceae bacterium]|jgi:hypothetical protein|nr:hypothetical protein [Nitrospiraceae bacterium]